MLTPVRPWFSCGQHRDQPVCSTLWQYFIIVTNPSSMVACCALCTTCIQGRTQARQYCLLPLTMTLVLHFI